MGRRVSTGWSKRRRSAAVLAVGPRLHQVAGVALAQGLGDLAIEGLGPRGRAGPGSAGHGVAQVVRQVAAGEEQDTLALADRGDFLEHATFSGNLYGTR